MKTITKPTREVLAVRLPSDVKAELKSIAADAGLPMQAVVEVLLKDALKGEPRLERRVEVVRSEGQAPASAEA